MMPEIYYLAAATLITLFLILIVRMAVSMGRMAKSPGRPSHITITGGPVYIGANGIPVEFVPSDSHQETCAEPSESESPPPAGDERRESPRQPVLTAVDYVKKGRLFKAISSDVSASGIFLKASGNPGLQVDDRLTLTFEDTDGTPRKHTGKIVRTTPQGMGVHFAAA